MALALLFPAVIDEDILWANRIQEREIEILVIGSRAQISEVRSFRYRVGTRWFTTHKCWPLLLVVCGFRYLELHT